VDIIERARQSIGAGIRLPIFREMASIFPICDPPSDNDRNPFDLAAPGRETPIWCEVEQGALPLNLDGSACEKRLAEVWLVHSRVLQNV
jgi:hypothetical protein